MYCKHCGTLIDEDSAFCKACGGSQNDTGEVVSPKNQAAQHVSLKVQEYYSRSKRSLVSCCIGAVLCLSGILCLVGLIFVFINLIRITIALFNEREEFCSDYEKEVYKKARSNYVKAMVFNIVAGILFALSCYILNVLGVWQAIRYIF